MLDNQWLLPIKAQLARFISPRSFMIYAAITLANLLILLPIFTVQHRVFLPDAGDQLVGFFPGKVGDNLLSAWGVWNFGIPQETGPGKIMWFSLQMITGSAWLTQVIIVFGGYSLASISFALFFINSRLSKSLLLVPASIAYSYNWVSFHTLQLHFLWIGTAIPLALLFATRILLMIGRRLHNVIGLTIPIAMANLFYTPGGLGYVGFIVLPAVFAGFIGLRGVRDTRNFIVGVISILLSFPLAILLLFPFFYPALATFLGHGFLGYVSAGSGGSLTASTPLQRLFYMSTIMPTPLSSFLTMTSPMLDNALWPIGIVAPVLSLVALFNVGRFRRALSLALFATLLVLTILINMIVLNYAFVNEIYSLVPLMYIFIMAQNYLIALGPITGILAMLGLETVSSSLRRRKLDAGKIKRLSLAAVPLALSIILVISSISAHNFAPLSFNSLYERQLSYGGIQQPVTSQLPSYFEDILVHFNNMRATYGPFRVLWMPDPLWFTQADWSEGSPDTLNLHTLNDPVLHGRLLAAFANVMDSRLRANTSNFGAGIAPFGFKYVVTITSIKYFDPPQYNDVNGDPIQPRGNATLYAEYFNRQRDLVLVNSTSNYLIYLNTAIPKENYGIFWSEDGTISPGGLNQTSFVPNIQNGNVTIREMSPTYGPSRYRVEVDSPAPVWLVFNQRYDPGWRATTSQAPRSELSHAFVSGWSNGFFVPGAGVRDVILSFDGQTALDESWIISGATFAVITAFGILSYYRIQISRGIRRLQTRSDELVKEDANQY